nr:hypothetical protein [Aeromonas sp.]
RLSNIDSNYFDRVHVVIPQVERCQPKYETDRAGRGRPSHHYIGLRVPACGGVVEPPLDALVAKLFASLQESAGGDKGG